MSVADRGGFLVRFNRADRTWATWVAWVLEDAGYSVFFQDWDFRGNFVEHMNRAHAQAHRTLAVLSDHYFGSDFTLAEWSARFAQDPAGREDRLVPAKVGPLADEGVLGPLIYADLTGCDEAEARERLLGRVAKAVDASHRSQPAAPPGLPPPPNPPPPARLPRRPRPPGAGKPRLPPRRAGRAGHSARSPTRPPPSTRPPRFARRRRGRDPRRPRGARLPRSPDHRHQ